MMTVSTVRRVSRACEPRSRYKDSGVVTRISPGCFSCCLRDFALVSPVRTATEGNHSSVPSSLYNQVAGTTPEDANDSFLVLISPDYKQPNEWKFSIGGTYRLPYDIQWDFDYLHTELRDAARFEVRHRR